MSEMQARARTALPAIVGGTLALGVVAFYVAILAGEGEGDLRRSRPLFLVTLLGLSGLVLLFAWSASSPRVRYGALLTAALVLSGWAILGSLSIGILLVPSAVLAWLAALAERRRLQGSATRWITAAAVVLGVGAVAFALALPD